MQSDKYYKILGLSPGASEQEIRKKYRVLAMKFHPDKNPDPNAEELFIQITEAYEILIGKRQAPSAAGGSVRKRNSKEEREARVKEARMRYAEQVLKEKMENERYFRYLTQGRKWKTIRITAILGVLISTLLILDVFLPHHFEEDKVTHFKRNVGAGPSGQNLGLIRTESDRYYWISKMTYSLYSRSHRIYVESSWIFHNPVQVISREKLKNIPFNTHFTFYNGAFILIGVLLIPLLTMRFKRKSAGFTLFYHISYYGVSAVILIFLLTNNRWAHLLTLGFF